MKRLLAAAVILVSAVLVAGCGGSSTPPPPMPAAAFAALDRAQTSVEASAQQTLLAEQSCTGTGAWSNPECTKPLFASADQKALKAFTSAFAAALPGADEACAAALNNLSVATLRYWDAWSAYADAVKTNLLVSMSELALNEARDEKMPAAHAAFTSACS
jgi:hypothetical protein